MRHRAQIAPQRRRWYVYGVAGALGLSLLLAGCGDSGNDGRNTGSRSNVETRELAEKTPASPEKGAPREAERGALPTAASGLIGAPAETGSLRPGKRYLDAVWSELHFKPAIDTATNAQCLACHAEILDHQPRTHAPAGVAASNVLAWYQTLDTYEGAQATFHARHLTTPLAREVMNLKCNFCHQGHDPREESGDSSATSPVAALGDFRMRKQVNPEKSCLMCHGSFPAEIMGLEGGWHENREAFETEDAPNGCLMCHADQFRTVRHQVNYLNADAIEAKAQAGSSDLCLGCHGGRAWYRTSFPYPRHPWPDMAEETPDWAKDRPTESAPEHRVSAD